MDEELKVRLDVLRNDYRAITGRGFDHFYCPMLFLDEEAALCKGHVVNQAFESSPRNWTVQRRDIDGFYGSRFEADFTVLQDLQQWEYSDFITNATLRRKLEPHVWAGEKKVDFFVAQGTVPEWFTPVIVDGDVSALIGLKMSREEALAVKESDWGVGISKDLRVPALVSLIKAAYLTIFSLFGYRYVLSAAGHLIGWSILGRFFLQNIGRSRAYTLEAAADFFRPFAHMVRPVASDLFGFRGTLTDRTVIVCWASSGFPWAIIVFVKTGDLLHSVMLPTADHPEAVLTFLGFMSNSNESIAVRVARLTEGNEGRIWEMGKESRMRWPKVDSLVG